MTGGVFVCLATLASQTTWVAAVAMAVVGFGVIFAGVVSSVLAGATTALLLAFILPVSLAAPASAVPGRLAGWAMDAGVALVAIALLWPAPAHDPLRGAAAAACRVLAARLRAGVAYLLSGMDEQFALDRDHAAAQADQAVEALRGAFLAMPYRPTGLSTPARTTVRLVDGLNWLNSIVIQPGLHRDGVHRVALRVKEAAAAVLDRAADLLDSRGGSSDELDAAVGELAAARAEMQKGVMTVPPVRSLRPASEPPAGDPDTGGEPASEFITSLDPAFRAEELSYAVSLIARNVELTAAAKRRNWRDRWLGRQPAGVPGTLSAARERIASYLEPHSVWLHNSLRGAAGLGLAVLVARLTDVQHSFWVVLGTLSVLRSNALNTGQDAVRAILGTVAGFIIVAASATPLQPRGQLAAIAHLRRTAAMQRHQVTSADSNSTSEPSSSVNRTKSAITQARAMPGAGTARHILPHQRPIHDLTPVTGAATKRDTRKHPVGPTRARTGTGRPLGVITAGYHSIRP